MIGSVAGLDRIGVDLVDAEVRALELELTALVTARPQPSVLCLLSGTNSLIVVAKTDAVPATSTQIPD